ncbi:hypothetical protein [Paenibacillus popilliae]|uniref:Uncharacterized protein n=1 Tax=Paenibacillus popilliae ATCC 14706 TaxID=1212764 RepID=M9LPC7_PAEPP|nr:hypothetical protein [Paenibacillus popilliae]GAC42366.1 hypothetical protein PPOP_1723 [Paenibacillus popilliae ATCC 14706]
MKKRICMLMVALILALTTGQFVQSQKASASILFLVDYALYGQALEKGESVPNNHSEETEKRSLPTKGQKLSSKDLVRNGKVVQRRYYDGDGNADVDIDYDHSDGDNCHTFPHRHKWTWKNGESSRGPAY